jgi:hypothetical protein
MGHSATILTWGWVEYTCCTCCKFATWHGVMESGQIMWYITDCTVIGKMVDIGIVWYMELGHCIDVPYDVPYFKL